jgi:GTP pyrophosphokinase
MASYGDRIIKARWAEDDRQHYEIRLDIVGTDRKGIIQDVSKVALQQNNVSMTSINFSTDHGIFEGKITLSVVDRHQVDHILEEMRKVDGVVNVSRHEDN